MGSSLDFKKAFGERIREIREVHGWDQEELAARVPCSPPYISKMERGHVTCSPEMVVRLARALMVTVDMLYCGESDEVRELAKAREWLSAEEWGHIFRTVILFAREARPSTGRKEYFSHPRQVLPSSA